MKPRVEAPATCGLTINGRFPYGLCWSGPVMGVHAVVKCAILITIVLSHKWSTVMGSPTLEKIRSEALNLPESERAELAHNLVASLDGPLEPDVEKAWDAEILRRLAEIKSGTANLIDREEFGRRMRARMSSP